MKKAEHTAWILAVILLFQPFAVLAAESGAHPVQEQTEAPPDEKAKARDREDHADPESDSNKRRFFRDFWQDEKRLWSSPFRASSKDLLVWGGLLALTGVLIHNDEAIYRDIKEFQAEHEWADKATPFLSDMAQGYPFALAGAIWVTGALTRNDHAKETGYLALQAMLHSFVVVQVVKHLTGRARPSAFGGEDRWAGPAGFFKRYEEGKWSHYDAMFSGHTITLWSLATVLAHQYRKSVVVPVLAYSLATLGGLATITDDLHWISDVVVGAAIGYAISRFVIRRRSKNFQIAPVIHRDGVGIGVRILF
ncbi:MAG TPA: phosphatase PAP2 family protein [Candidatus Aminicenantes bacterium]|nr:phosphatase PAP2 family protein [Candidatus Aminicenantes bacterium]